MMATWDVKKLAKVEKIGDYIFTIEFMSPEEKAKVLDGGPWKHKGDTLIIIHYYGLVSPSEIHIESMGLVL
jgi:hypothetical protein